VCAAEALIVAAGGKVTDAWGVPFDYRTQDLSNDRGVVATNGSLHDSLLKKLSEYRASLQ
jgi:3'-phosphoadenosine 5'-phosphosulfate (PAPS) 3'-phosphatase